MALRPLCLNFYYRLLEHFPIETTSRKNMSCLNRERSSLFVRQ